jgi:hypothetical protein
VESWAGDVGKDEKGQSALEENRRKGNGGSDGVSQSRNALAQMKFELNDKFQNSNVKSMSNSKINRFWHLNINI